MEICKGGRTIHTFDCAGKTKNQSVVIFQNRIFLLVAVVVVVVVVVVVAVAVGLVDGIVVAVAIGGSDNHLVGGSSGSSSTIVLIITAAIAIVVVIVGVCVAHLLSSLPPQYTQLVQRVRASNSDRTHQEDQAQVPAEQDDVRFHFQGRPCHSHAHNRLTAEIREASILKLIQRFHRLCQTLTSLDC